MFRKTDNIMWNVPHVKYECEEYIHIILPVPRNIVMDLNNVMMMDRNDGFWWYQEDFTSAFRG
jgi:hypothetical protein